MTSVWARVVAVVSVGWLAAGCGGGGNDDTSVARVVQVPEQVATIGEAVAAARPGTIIDIGPGVYHEAVTVETQRVTLRGRDRNTVILDGRFALANGISVKADDVAVENLTVRHYNQNGIVFNGIAAASGGPVDPSVVYGAGSDVLRGYRVSWVTTHNNGLYGVYAFAARDGVIEHSYASGHPDSGFYVGQCRPCNVVLRYLTVERNAIGYYGTNASGGVIVMSSVFRGNRLGIAPNSQDMEKLAPQADAVIVGNVVADNDDPMTPRIPSGYFGGGIAIGGGTRNLVLRNRVTGHDRAGIELLDLDDYRPEGNRIEGNVLSGNALDLVYAVAGAVDGGGNCFASNVFVSSLPVQVQQVLPCDGAAQPFALEASPTLAEPPSVDFRTVPAPPPQPTMPQDQRGSSAGAGPVPTVDIDAIGVPA
jgi:nitrous oxidase accessory protein NosD